MEHEATNTIFTAANVYEIQVYTEDNEVFLLAELDEAYMDFHCNSTTFDQDEIREESNILKLTDDQGKLLRKSVRQLLEEGAEAAYGQGDDGTWL